MNQLIINDSEHLGHDPLNEANNVELAFNQDQQINEEPEQVSRIFKRAVFRVLFVNKYLMLFQLAKIVGFFMIQTWSFSVKCQLDQQSVWEWMIFLSSLITLYYHFYVQRICSIDDFQFEIAQKYGQTVELQEGETWEDVNDQIEFGIVLPNSVEIDDSITDEQLQQMFKTYMTQNYSLIDKKVQALTLQIQQEIKLKDAKCKILFFVSFIMFQALEVWGCVTYFKAYNIRHPESNCELINNTYQFLIIVFGFFQFFEFYMTVVLLTIIFPFLLIYYIYRRTGDCMKNFRKKKFLDRLKTITYKNQNLKGDPECPICMCPYEIKEQVITLPCNAQHHFHKECVLKWLSVSMNCPLCRTQFQ